MKLVLSLALVMGMAVFGYGQLVPDFFLDFKLDNGLTVIVLPDSTTADVEVQLHVRYPILLEGEQAGRANLVGKLLAAGTDTRSAEAIQDQLVNLSAHLSTHGRGITAGSKAIRLGALLELVADCAKHAAFSEPELGVAKAELLESLAPTPITVADKMLRQLVFGTGHPYGERTTAKTIANVTSADCRSFHRQYFRPRLAYLIIRGPIDMTTAKHQTQLYFADWKNEGPLLAELYDTAPLPKGVAANFIALPNRTTAVVQLGYALNLRPGSKDMVGMHLFNALLANTIRQSVLDKGWAEACEIAFLPDSDIGQFRFSVMAAAPDSVGVLIMAVQGELANLQKTLISDEVLEAARATAADHFRTSLAIPGVLEKYAMDAVRVKTAKANYIQFSEILAALDATDILELAQAYLRPSQFQLLGVGPQSVADQLKLLTTNGQVLYFTPEGYAMKMVGTPIAEDVTAEGVIAQYIEAIGGEQVLTAIRDMTITLKAEQPPLVMIQERKRYNLFRQDVFLNGELLNTTLLNGARAQVRQMGTAVPLSAEVADDLRAQSELYPETRYRELGYQLTLDGSHVVHGKATYAVVATHPNGKKITHYYDTSTGFKLRTVATFDGKTSVTDLDNYQRVAGVMYPHRVVLSGLSPEPLTFSLESVKHNADIPLERFDIIEN